MNFFLCNKCKKRSDDNILNLYNNTEKFPNDRKHNISNLTNVDNNMINKADTSERLQPMDYLKNNEEINMSIKDLEEDDDDDLQIIEYPYEKNEKNNKSNIQDKLKKKEFKNKKSKFNQNYLIEKDVINKLNYINNLPNQNNVKSPNYIIKTKENRNKIIEKKDTIIEPSNLALSSLIQDINKNSFHRNKINAEKKEIKETQNSFKNIKYLMTNKNYNKVKNQINNTTKLTKNNKNPKKAKKSDYSNNIIKKKNILKNKIISNKNLYINNLSISNLIINSKKNNFNKSYSFNNFENQKNNLNKFRNESNNTDNSLTYSLVFKNDKKMKMGIFSPQKIKKSKNKIIKETSMI